jgi:peptidoglycan/LPS O-acetylase OafA/YrhL
LRGVAALAIVLFHYIGLLYNQTWVWPPGAYLAVDFFFLLSGFVVAHAYEARLRAGMTPGRFAVLRLIRLYPLYWLGTSIPIAAAIFKSLASGKPFTLSLLPLSYVLNILFLPAPPDGTGELNIFPHNSPSWSLSLEMGVNLIFALLCLRLTPARFRYLVLLAGCGLFYAFWVYDDASIGWSWQGYWGGWARVSFSFFLGVLLHRAFQSRQPKPLAPWCGAGLAAALFAVFALPHTGIFVPILCCFALFPLIVWLGARATLWNGLAGLSAWMGRLSYAVYITHRPLFDVFMSAARKLGIDIYPHPRVTVMIFTLCVFAVAVLLDRFYDVPLRTYLGQKFSSTSVKKG